jgi:DNA invertase Pin-like site-specific DNA recombinase
MFSCTVNWQEFLSVLFLIAQNGEYMQRKAVIYIRTSSENQGEKASPSEQEDDCQLLAKEKGLTIVRVYRDIEKYRVKNRLVNPSESRVDRPGLLAMLKDAAKGEFDVILAWRED